MIQRWGGTAKPFTPALARTISTRRPRRGNTSLPLADDFQAAVRLAGPEVAQPAMASHPLGPPSGWCRRVAHVGRGDEHTEDKPEGIDQRMSLSSRHLFARIIGASCIRSQCSS